MVKVKSNKKGFSLMEVIFYMVLVGILIGVAVPSLGKLKEKAEETKIMADSGTIRNVALLDGLSGKEHTVKVRPKHSKGKAFLNGKLVESVDENSFRRVADWVKEESGTDLGGEFFMNEGFDVLYMEEALYLREELPERPELAEDIPVASEKEFEQDDWGNWKYIGNKKTVRVPHKLGGEELTSYQSMFSETAVERVISDNPNIVNMKSTFSKSTAPKLDLRHFETKNVKNMQYMFSGAQAKKIDLRYFDTRNVETMREAFRDLDIDVLDLSYFETPNLLNLDQTFRGTRAGKINVSRFDTSKVQQFKWCFYGSDISQVDLSRWEINAGSDHSQFFGKSTITSGFAKNQETADLLNKTLGGKKVFKVK